METSSNITYRLNNKDELIYVNDEWIRFANDNDCPELAPGKVLHKPLWNFITDITTQQLYRDILKRVRAHPRYVR